MPAPGILDLEREEVSARYEIVRYGGGGAFTAAQACALTAAATGSTAAGTAEITNQLDNQKKFVDLPASPLATSPAAALTGSV